jgi:hypothetical protein
MLVLQSYPHPSPTFSRLLSPSRVDIPEYPIYAGAWQLARDCQLYFDEIPVEVSGLLATFMDDADPKQAAKDIAYSVLWEIQACDDFTYNQRHANTLAKGKGFTSRSTLFVHPVCPAVIRAIPSGLPGNARAES